MKTKVQTTKANKEANANLIQLVIGLTILASAIIYNVITSGITNVNLLF